MYAASLILLRRPRLWAKTEKSGVMTSPELVTEGCMPISEARGKLDLFLQQKLDEENCECSCDSRVYVILPCYNEEQNLSVLIEDIASSMPNEFPFEIIAVDDGSWDNSGLLLKHLAAKYPVTMLNHHSNMGLSATLRDGLSYAIATARANDFIITMDSDNTHRACYIRSMLEVARQGVDIVIASRYVNGGMQIGVSNNRILLSKYLNSVLGFLSGLSIRDSTSGYRCYRGSVLRKGQEKYNSSFLNSKGFEIQVELIVKLGLLTNKIKEMPFELRYDRKNGKSKMPMLETIQNYIILSFKIPFWRIRNQ